MSRFPINELKPCRDGIATHKGRVTAASPPAIWSNLAFIAPANNAHDASPGGACAITVKLTVKNGRVGVGIILKDRRDTLLDEGFIEAGTGSTVVQLFVNDIDASGSLIFRNGGQSSEQIAFELESVEVRPIAEQASIENRYTLIAIYDFNIFPLTYDFAFFLMAAEMARCDAGLKDIHVLFIPANREALHRLPDGFDAAVNGEGRQWRFFHILLPLLRLLPSVQGFSMPASRNEAHALADRAAHRFPEAFKPNEVPIHEIYKRVNGKLHQKEAYQRLRATPSATKYVRQWLAPRAKGRKLVTITLRQYKFDPERNSDLPNWDAFARGLDKKGFFPVVMPDTDTAMDALAGTFEGIEVFSVASFDLELRMAIYQEAWLNMLTNGGPFALLCLGQDTPFLLFKFLIPGSPFCSESHLKELGMPPGSPFPYHNPMQRIVWESDSLVVIQREFDAMCAATEASAGNRRIVNG